MSGNTAAPNGLPAESEMSGYMKMLEYDLQNMERRLEDAGGQCPIYLMLPLHDNIVIT
jgi:hypothetical protein